MMKRLVVVGMVVCATAASAMPTKKELAEAQKMVSEITAQDMRDLKAKKKTPAEVAKNHMELAASSNGEAGKFLFLQGAFKLYAKAGDYDGAATALETMNNEIKDMDPAVIVDIYNKAIFRSIKDRSPKLFVIKEVARKTANSRKQLPALEKAVKKNPKDAAAQKAYAECLAELGEWEKALDAFARSGGKVAEMAKSEKEGTAKLSDLAVFWWDYGRDDTNAYRIHAAELYEDAMLDVDFTGLTRQLAEKRVKGLESDAEAMAQWKALSKKKAQQMPFDKPFTLKLAEGAELEFVPVSACQFNMGNGTGGTHRVTITRPYWIGKELVRRKHYLAFDPECKQGSKPDDAIATRQRAMDFSEWLTKRYRAKLPRGYVFRLPSDAEWVNAREKRLFHHSGAIDGTLDMASGPRYQPWWWKNECLHYGAPATDPLVYEGEAWVAWQNGGYFITFKNHGGGHFRLAIGPDLIAEKKRAAAQKAAAK